MFLNRMGRGGFLCSAPPAILLLLADTVIMAAQSWEEMCPGHGSAEVLCRGPGNLAAADSCIEAAIDRSGLVNARGAQTFLWSPADECIDASTMPGGLLRSFYSINYPSQAFATLADDNDRGDVVGTVPFQNTFLIPPGSMADLHLGIDARGPKTRGEAPDVGGEGITPITLALMLAASAADLASTEYALGSGRAAEGNPFMQSRPLRMTTSLAVPVVAYLLTRSNPRLGKWVAIVHIGMRGSFTARNIYTGVTLRWK